MLCSLPCSPVKSFAVIIIASATVSAWFKLAVCAFIFIFSADCLPFKLATFCAVTFISFASSLPVALISLAVKFNRFFALTWPLWFMPWSLCRFTLPLLAIWPWFIKAFVVCICKVSWLKFKIWLSLSLCIVSVSMVTFPPDSSLFWLSMIFAFSSKFSLA